MNKKVLCLMLLLVIYVMMQLLFIIFKNSYDISYNVNGFNVVEEYDNKLKNTYYVNIISNDKVYAYEWKSNYLGKKIITSIKYYRDNDYECILPIVKDKILFDLTCYGGDTLYYYHNMNKSDDIDDFLDGIDIYDSNKFYGNELGNNIDMYSYYLDNIDFGFSVESYRGIINNKDIISLFDNDKYSKGLSVFTDNYYMVPNYEQDYEFNEIFVINLKNNKVNKINMDYSISFDAYIQGIDGDIVYLFDLENKRQYKIDASNLFMERIGSLSSDINIYVNNEWVKKNVSDVMENKYVFDFKGYRVSLGNNTYVDSINDYIYTYKKVSDGYDVYKSNKYNPNIKNYLFKISDIDSVRYVDDKLFFKKDDYIGYYSELFGMKKIIQGNELLFNKGIKFNIT